MTVLFLIAVAMLGGDSNRSKCSGLGWSICVNFDRTEP